MKKSIPLVLLASLALVNLSACGPLDLQEIIDNTTIEPGPDAPEGTITGEIVTTEATHEAVVAEIKSLKEKGDVHGFVILEKDGKPLPIKVFASAEIIAKLKALAAGEAPPVTEKILPTQETNDAVLAEVERLQKSGVLSDVSIAESFPVQITATGPADVIKKLQDQAAGKTPVEPSEPGESDVITADINPTAETNDAVVAEVQKQQIAGVLFDVVIRESFPVQITASGPADVIKKIQALAQGEETGDNTVKFETLSKVTISAGSRTEPENVIVTDEETYTKLWEEHTGAPASANPPPAVDFSTESVIAVFMGEKFTGGYSVEVTAVSWQDDTLLVEYTETEPHPDAITAQVISYPVHMIKINQVGVEKVEYKKTVVQTPADGDESEAGMGLGL